ncbi:START-like domain [Phytophthora cinnamomi]|uniref:START-like domain n=1 Tax=Phytophthora cinnamomi TaxID=4785 RepID=UPI003559F0B1|nr:START-like domain [Phytophthora cinnamomi]
MPKSFQAQGVVPERIYLSDKQQKLLTDMADGIIAETLEIYETFITNGRDLPNSEWKHVKSKEKVHVYRSRLGEKPSNHQQQQPHSENSRNRPRLLSLSSMERHQRDVSGKPYIYDSEEPILDVKDSTSTHSSSGSSSLDEDYVLSKVKPPHIPLVVAAGVIDGSVEDVAFGGFANTKYSWIVRNSYVHNDVFDDRKVLATLQLPTEEDPFRSVTIKWATGNYGTFTSRRDFLYVESMGMAYDSDGEKIFYNLIHSIDLDDCPPLEKRHNVVRAQMTTCYIGRQLNSNSVEMFCRGFVDPRGDVPENYGVLKLAHNVANCSGFVECSNLKKLSWLMSLRRRSDAAGVTPSIECSVCKKSLNKLGFLQSPSKCSICRRVTCNKCSVRKKLTVNVSSKEIVQKPFAFCLSCVIEARELSAWEVATSCLWSR